MKTFEVIIKDLLSNKTNFIKILIGFLIGLLPIVNIACLGYLLQISRGQNELPKWETTKESIIALYVDGLRGLLLFTIFYILPVAGGYFAGMCFSWIGEGFISLGTCIGILIGSQSTTIAFLHNEQINKSNIWSVAMKISKMTIQSISIFLFPSLLFVGLQLAGVSILGPMYVGSTLFLGLTLLIVYAKESLAIFAE